MRTCLYAVVRRCSSSCIRDSCTNTRRVVVQRWPAVPTAPKTIAGTTSFMSENSSTMIALLPPSSSSDLPRRRATRTPTSRPTCVEPVKDTRSTRLSSTKRTARSTPSSMNSWKIGGSPLRSSTRLQMCCTATAHSARLRRRLPDRDVAADRREERIPGPHGDRKIERPDHADDAERVPLLEHAVIRTLRMHRPGRTACGTARPRNPRCRSSPALRRRLQP